MHQCRSLTWKVAEFEKYTFIHFEIEDVLLTPGSLKKIKLPDISHRRHLGLIISGRGPVWLFCYLSLLAHDFAWVASYDPRLGGGIVFQRHTTAAPELGEIIRCQFEVEKKQCQEK